jgi:aminoglycoside/choline kinase family phosphotransferase
MESYQKSLLATKLLEESDVERFRRWFDLMGMQRHLKAVGIFSRLNIRDGKPGYLKDIPRTLRYVTEVGRNYPELAGFMRFLDHRVMPRLSGEALS